MFTDELLRSNDVIIVKSFVFPATSPPIAHRRSKQTQSNSLHNTPIVWAASALHLLHLRHLVQRFHNPHVSGWQLMALRENSTNTNERMRFRDASRIAIDTAVAFATFSQRTTVRGVTYRLRTVCEVNDYTQIIQV